MANSDINGFPRSGMPVLKDDGDRICLGTIYDRPLKIAGFIIDVIGANRLLGALTIGGALTGATSGAFSAGVTMTTLTATTGTFSGAVTITQAAGVTALTLATGSSLAMTGSIGSILFRPVKIWAENLDVTNMPTVDGRSLLGIIHATTFPSLNVTASSGTVATLKTIEDTASTVGLVLEGDRATPTNGDEIALRFVLSDSAGNQDTMAEIRAQVNDITSGAETSQLEFAVVTGGALATEMLLTSTNLTPSANDGNALGSATVSWADLFLASGAVINFNNGNVALTHSAGILTQSAGELRITSANVGTNADSVPTLSSTSTFTNKTLTSPTITTATLSGTQQLGENASIALDPAGSADGKYSGITIAGTAGATLAFGDLVYLSSADSRWELADADAASTADRMLGMVVLAAAADGDPTTLLLVGQIRADAAFPALTIGSPVYVGETAGDIQTAIPTGADNVIRRVGYALTADEIYFNPSMDSQVTVA